MSSSSALRAVGRDRVCWTRRQRLYELFSSTPALPLFTVVDLTFSTLEHSSTVVLPSVTISFVYPFVSSRLDAAMRVEDRLQSLFTQPKPTRIPMHVVFALEAFALRANHSDPNLPPRASSIK